MTWVCIHRLQGFPGGPDSEVSACNTGDVVASLAREDPLEGGMATTPIFLPGKSHGQRSLVGYSPRGHKESDTTEQLNTHTHTHTHTHELHLRVYLWCLCKLPHLYTYVIYCFLTASSQRSSPNSVASNNNHAFCS